MTLAPMYKAIKHETSGKPSIREIPAEFLGPGHQCNDGLLPSTKCNIYESLEMCLLGLQGHTSSLHPCFKHFILLWHL
jgi:hypothetical protein